MVYLNKEKSYFQHKDFYIFTFLHFYIFTFLHFYIFELWLLYVELCISCISSKIYQYNRGTLSVV